MRTVLKVFLKYCKTDFSNVSKLEFIPKISKKFTSNKEKQFFSKFKEEKFNWTFLAQVTVKTRWVILY